MSYQITRRIEDSLRWTKSRYEIDADLLARGYDATAIEAAWIELEISQVRHRQRRIQIPPVSNWLDFYLFTVCALWMGIITRLNAGSPFVRSNSPLFWLTGLIYGGVLFGLFYFLNTKAREAHPIRMLFVVLVLCYLTPMMFFSYMLGVAVR